MKEVASDRQKKTMLQKINVMSMLICQDNRSAPIPARTDKKTSKFYKPQIKTKTTRLDVKKNRSHDHHALIAKNCQFLAEVYSVLSQSFH